MGGRAFFPNREDQLPNVHATVAADAFRRYLLSYTPQNQEADGTFRRSTLTIDQPAVPRSARARATSRPSRRRCSPTIEFSAHRRRARQLPSCRPTTWSSSRTASIQKVESFQEAVAPMAIALVIDTSGSMRRAMDTAKQAARSFVTALRPADPLALVRFSDRSCSSTSCRIGARPPSTPSTGSRPTAARRFRRALRFDGGPEEARGPARHRAAHRRPRRKQPRHRPRQRPHRGRRAGHGARDRHDGLRDRPRHQRRSRRRSNSWPPRSGGAATFPADAGELEAEFTRVLDELRRRYVVGYTSTNSKRDGGWRQVVVGARQPGITIRSAAAISPHRGPAATGGLMRSADTTSSGW